MLLTKPRWAAIGLLLVGFVALFHQWFYTQHLHSIEKPQDWGHSYVVPLISLYMIHQRRAEIARTPVRAYWPGLIALLTGAACYFFFSVGALRNHMAQGFSMILALFGVVLLLLGPAMMRHLFLPIAYLGFGVTLAERVLIHIEFKLQMIAAKGGEVALALAGTVLGFSVQRAGNTLEMLTNSGQTLELGIAEACSGMRMVVAFVALAAAVAIIGCRHWWQRIAIVLLAVPVAVLLNVVRVMVLGLAQLIDPQLATGDVHIMIGTLLLVPGFMMFLGVLWALKQIIPDDEDDAKPKAQARVAIAAPCRGWAVLARPAFVASLAFLVSTAAAMGVGMAALGYQLRKNPIYPPDNRTMMQMRPDALDGWMLADHPSADRRESPEVEETLGTKNYISRIYVEREPEPGVKPAVIDFHAAYYTGMIDTVPHVPDRCLVGGGWSIVGGPWVVRVPLDESRWRSDPDVPPPLSSEARRKRESQPVRRVRLGARSDLRGYVRLPYGISDVRMVVTEFQHPRSPGRLFAGYFFIANGEVATQPEDVRLKAFSLEADYAYYAKLQLSSTDVGSAEELAAKAGRFLDDMLPEVLRCLPDWYEVEAGLYPSDNPRRAAVGSKTE